MSNKDFWMGILVMALVFAMTVVRCDNDPINTENETWSNVTTLDQIDGTWKAIYNQNSRPIKDMAKEQGLSWNSAMQKLLGNMTVTAKADITLTIDAGNKIWAMSMVSITIYSGGNINTVWFMLRAGMEGSEEMEITFDDITHSMSVAYEIPAETMSDEAITTMLSGGLKINQNGTKIEMPTNSLVQGLTTLIFIKQ